MKDLLYSYPFWLALFSVFVMALERVFPWRREQKQLRPYLWSDLIHLVFNGHFLGALVYGIYAGWVHERLVAWLEGLGLASALYAGVAGTWPIWAQIVVALLVVDFVQWAVHNLLHRITPLWELHKVHHSIVDGEMDFIVSFRFHWLEVVIYKSFLYVPLAFFGFGMEAIFFHAVFGTLVGHFNHANLNITWGPLKYLLNSPRMHIWHHDYEGDERTTKNFGIILSVWDWIFGTAYMPEHPPARLGYAGVEKMPRDFLAHAAWPLSAFATRKAVLAVAASGLGLLALGGLYGLSRGPLAFAGGLAQGPSSQPAKISLRDALHPPAEAQRALARFGEAAKAAGYAHPEWMVSAEEVAAALGAPELVLFDVRPEARYREGHLPTARNVDRDDYSVSAPVPGLSRRPEELVALLEREGVEDGAVLVLYGDGGAEPFRLWWTLRETIGVEARILDGGVQAWKRLLLPTDRAKEPKVAAGRLTTKISRRPALERWEELEARLRAPAHEAGGEVVLVDTRTVEEYRGEKKDEKAARAGRIPGAIHLSWSEFLVSLDDPRLRRPDELRATLEGLGIDRRDTVLTYCQSGTRSAVLVYALLQLGYSDAQLGNYGGSWAEYSRLETPVEVGPR